MPDIKRTRRHFVVALSILVGICLVCTGVLVSPIGRASRSGQEDIARLWGDLHSREREVTPLNGIDKKVVEAEKQIKAFYGERLPTSYASISQRLLEVASDNSVRLTGGRYHAEAADVPGLQRIRIEAGITGNYLQTVKFINALERDKMFFLIDRVALGEQQAGVGTVQLQIRMETFMRSGASGAGSA
jgi:type IV pilus assembly protein PilO